MNEIDYVLILGVDAISLEGQKFIRSMLRKISAVGKLIENAVVNLEIGVNGGMNRSNILEIVTARTDSLIASKAIYSSDGMREAIEELRDMSLDALREYKRTHYRKS